VKCRNCDRPFRPKTWQLGRQWCSECLNAYNREGKSRRRTAAGAPCQLARYALSSFDYLRQQLERLDDDPTRDWREYPCLEWDRARRKGTTRSPGTYGHLQDADGRLTSAHRAAYAVAVGPIPKGMQVLHHCDNPPCFRPVHLFLGTSRDNVLDCPAKNRRSPHYPVLIGEENPRSRLDRSQV
jgi:hypothetical protein